LNYRSVVLKHQALIDSDALSMLLLRIEDASSHRMRFAGNRRIAIAYERRARRVRDRARATGGR
jgi:hypothetical protein